MPRLENHTPYAGISLPSMAIDGTDLVVVIVCGRFQLPPPGITPSKPPLPCEEQPPVRLADEYNGEPDSSSLRYEGQHVPSKAATDVLLRGHAWGARGAASTRVDVTLMVHQRLRKTVAVFGDRTYGMGVGMAVPGSPRAFVKMPLLWERAFGGAEPSSEEPRPFEARNPVGRGFYTSALQAIDQLAPNLEDPNDLIGSSGHRPTPMGFGPIARYWQPRVGFAGTYDQKWIEERAPGWPLDVDARFFQSAPLDQQINPPLKGGEWVGVTGVAPDGQLQFQVPLDRIVLKSYFRDKVLRKRMVLDQLLIEPDDGTFTVTWRASYPLPKGMFDLFRSVVRCLEHWEDDPQ